MTFAVLRLLCFLCLALGLYLLLNPVAELLSFLPFVDSLLKHLFAWVALLLGLVVWAVATAVAWSPPRPPPPPGKS